MMKPELLAACHILTHYEPGERANYFAELNLGAYGPTNPLIVALEETGFVTISKTGAIIPDRALIRSLTKTQFAPEGYHLDNASLSFRSNYCALCGQDARTCGHQ